MAPRPTVLVPINHPWAVNFPERVVTLRKQKKMTRQRLAERIGVHVAQIRRYEAGTSQPTLDFIRGMAVARRDRRGATFRQ